MIFEQSFLQMALVKNTRQQLNDCNNPTNTETSGKTSVKLNHFHPPILVFYQNIHISY